MKKELKDYLHLYLGCECEIKMYHTEVYKKSKITVCVLAEAEQSGMFSYVPEIIKPILRPLSDMTEEEKNWLDEHENFVDNYKQNAEKELIIEWDAEKTAYLLSKHFDLFGLIESGLAVNTAELKSVSSL